MPKPIDPLRFPPHYETLLRQLSESFEPFIVDFGSAGEAKSFRFDWYAWLKSHARLSDSNAASAEIVAMGRPIVLSFREPSSIVFSNRLTGRFAQSLERAGISSDPPRLTLPQADAQPIEIVRGSFVDSPLRAFEDTMSKLGYKPGPKKGESQ